MNYQEYAPAPWLLPFIDCYWTLHSYGQQTRARRVIPDICADIILNLGEEVKIFNGHDHKLGGERVYLVGNMTTFQDTILPNGTYLAGIRFKPFGLNALLGITLQGTADKIEELTPREFLPRFSYADYSGDALQVASLAAQLNQYFSALVKQKNNDYWNSLIGTILQQQGRVSIYQLAQQFHISVRQLERRFETNVGVSLKEICNVTRFQHAYQLVRNRGERSLLDIAFEAGYYDHAHLTKHFKRYAGCLPSQL